MEESRRPNRGGEVQHLDGDRLTLELERRNCSKTHLAERAGLTRETVDRATRGGPIRYLSARKLLQAVAELPVMEGDALEAVQ